MHGKTPSVAAFISWYCSGDKHNISSTTFVDGPNNCTLQLKFTCYQRSSTYPDLVDTTLVDNSYSCNSAKVMEDFYSYNFLLREACVDQNEISAAQISSRYYCVSGLDNMH